LSLDEMNTAHVTVEPEHYKAARLNEFFMPAWLLVVVGHTGSIFTTTNREA